MREILSAGSSGPFGVSWVVSDRAGTHATVAEYPSERPVDAFPPLTRAAKLEHWQRVANEHAARLEAEHAADAA